MLDSLLSPTCYRLKYLSITILPFRWKVVMKSDGEFMYINLCLCVHFQSYNATCNCFGFARSPSLTETAMQQNEDRVSKREQLKYHESYNLNFIDIWAQDQLRRNATCSGTLKQRRRRLGRAAVVPSYSANIRISISIFIKTSPHSSSMGLIAKSNRWIICVSVLSCDRGCSRLPIDS